MQYAQGDSSLYPSNHLAPSNQHPYQPSPTESSHTASDAYSSYDPEYAWGSGSNWYSNVLQPTVPEQTSDFPASLTRAYEISPSTVESGTGTHQTPLNTKTEDTSCHGTSGIPIAVGNSAGTTGHDRKKAQNRAAQRAFRARKEKELHDLYAEVDRLGRELQQQTALDHATQTAVTAMKHLSNALKEGGGTVTLTALPPDHQGCPDDYDPSEIFVWIPGEHSSSRLLDPLYATTSNIPLSDDPSVDSSIVGPYSAESARTDLEVPWH